MILNRNLLRLALTNTFEENAEPPCNVSPIIILLPDINDNSHDANVTRRLHSMLEDASNLYILINSTTK